MLLKKLPKRTSFTTDAAQSLETLINFIRPSDAGKNLQVTETQDEDQWYLRSQIDLQWKNDRNWERWKDEIGKNIDRFRLLVNIAIAGDSAAIHPLKRPISRKVSC